MPEYSPFEKSLNDLQLADLAILSAVLEGWYVEYKVQFPGLLSAAKSISSFANSYGGWLFYGVEETPNKTRMAGGFPGISTTDLSKVEEAIRQAAATKITPSPYFEKRTLIGPEPSIGLAADKAIVIIKIPRGNNAPYIHASGRIYRRVDDASDPVHETDRHFLDLLWGRNKETRKSFAKFIKRDFELSESEDRVTFIKLMFFVDPWEERQLWNGINFEEFSVLMADADPKSGGIPFDNIFTTEDGFLARQVLKQNASMQVLTWQWFRDCTCQVTVPLNSSACTSAGLMEFLAGYREGNNFYSLSSTHSTATVVDLSLLYGILRSVLLRLQRLMDLCGQTWPVFFKAQVRGAWRRIPFLDLPEFSAFVRTHGVPVMQYDKFFVPPGRDPDNCFELENRTLGEPHLSGEDEIIALRSLDALTIFFFLAQSFGLPMSVFGLTPTGEPQADWLGRLNGLTERAQNRLGHPAP